MPLSAKQKKIVSLAPARERAALANLLNQSNQKKAGRQPAPTRGRSRGRGSRGRGRGRGSFPQFSKFTTRSAPLARGAVMEKRQSTTIAVKRSMYADSFNTPKPNEVFTAQVLDITPTNLAWLQQLATLFGRYKFKYYGYRYVTASPTNIGGNVWAAFQPRSTQDLPTTLADVQNLAQHKIGNVYSTWREFTFIDPKLLNERWFLTQAIPQDANGNISNFSDRSAGRILYGTIGAGNPGAPILGDLQITCEVVFDSPTSIGFTHPVNLPDDQAKVFVRLSGGTSGDIRLEGVHVVTKPTFPLPGMDFEITRTDGTLLTGTAAEVEVSLIKFNEEVIDPMELRIRELENLIKQLGLKGVNAAEMENIPNSDYIFPDPEEQSELITLASEDDEEADDEEYEEDYSYILD